MIGSTSFHVTALEKHDCLLVVTLSQINENENDLAEPLTDIFNTGLKRGEYPDIYKFETCTPVPKKYPVKSTSQLRNISGLFHFDKIYEKLISQLIISDMEASLDPKQFGNQKGRSIQHYLVLMIHKILEALDKNAKGEVSAVIANLVDWENAFPR